MVTSIALPTNTVKIAVVPKASSEENAAFQVDTENGAYQKKYVQRLGAAWLFALCEDEDRP
jgi:hypothetical protein